MKSLIPKGAKSTFDQNGFYRINKCILGMGIKYSISDKKLFLEDWKKLVTNMCFIPKGAKSKTVLFQKALNPLWSFKICLFNHFTEQYNVGSFSTCCGYQSPASVQNFEIVSILFIFLWIFLDLAPFGTKHRKSRSWEKMGNDNFFIFFLILEF